MGVFTRPPRGRGQRRVFTPGTLTCSAPSAGRDPAVSSLLQSLLPPPPLPPPPSPRPPLLPASLPFSLPLPQLPSRSRSGLPAFALSIGQYPRRSVLRPAQLRTGLVLSTAARKQLGTGFPASLGKKPSPSGEASSHWLRRGPLPHLCISKMIGLRHCRLKRSQSDSLLSYRRR